MITSFRHDQERLRRRKQLFAVLLGIALFFFVVRGPLADLLGGVLVTAGRPFWAFRDAVAERFENVSALLSSKVELQQENDHLKEELQAMTLGSYSRDLLRDENDRLKAELGRPSEFSLMLARVLETPERSPYDTFVIDVGSNDGIDQGMGVFIDGDFKIGEISRVWKTSSLVTLYSAPDSELPVTIGTSSIPATAHGEGGGNFAVVLPKGTPVTAGDLVDIPALAPEFAGRVDGILKPDGTSLQTIYVKLPVNIYQVKWVYVGIPEAKKPIKNI